jgi:hypothetical protein
MSKTTYNTTKNHIFSLGFHTGFKANSKKLTRLYIYHRYGTEKHKPMSSPLRIPMNIWDNKLKRIKNSKVVEYSEEQKWINDFYTKKKDLQIALHKNETTLEQCFKKLLNISTSGGVLKNFDRLSTNANIPLSNRIKTKSFLRTIINHLIRADYVQYAELDYKHLQNHSDKANIKKVIMNLSVKNATKNDYFDVLNKCVEIHPDIIIQPFPDTLTEDEVSKQKLPVPRRNIQGAIGKIKDNHQWLEAYLYFLFAFSLRGLNGSDICMLNEDWLEDENESKPDKILHYMPSYKRLKGGKKDFNKKIYIVGKRSKTGKPIKILFNQFPTLVLHRLLKLTIQRNRPHLAYKGKDDVRLYNINYATEKGKREWHNLRDTYSKQIKHMTGFSVNHCRHTFTKYLKKMNVDERVLGVSLGHTQRRNAKDFYVSPVSQFRMDIYHIKVLEDLNINYIIKMLHKGYGSRHLEKDIWGKDDKGEKILIHQISGDWFPLLDIELETLDLPLAVWDYKKEIKLQELYEDEMDNVDVQYDDNMNVIETDVDEQNFSTELKALIKEKKEVLGKKYEDIHSTISVDYVNGQVISKVKKPVVSIENKVQKLA